RAGAQARALDWNAGLTAPIRGRGTRRQPGTGGIPGCRRFLHRAGQVTCPLLAAADTPGPAATAADPPGPAPAAGRAPSPAVTSALCRPAVTAPGRPAAAPPPPGGGTLPPPPPRQARTLRQARTTPPPR